MAKKGRKKRRAKSEQPNTIWKNLEKGNAKEALKQAKVRFRQDAGADNRALLERAFLGRIEQLHELKMAREASAALKELLELKPTVPHVVEHLPRLQVILGDETVDVGRVLETDPSLLKEIVDQAILDGRNQLPDVAELPRQVELVRQALIAVEQGEDDEAQRLLPTVSRKSPLADWRLFIRGLSAFYHEDMARAQQNWSRLEADRPSNRIARTLLVAAGVVPEEENQDLANNLRKLKTRVQSDRLTAVLERLATSWCEERIDPFFRDLKKLRQRFFSQHEDLIRRILELVWKRAARLANETVINELAKMGPPPHLDPHWWRARALVREELQTAEEIDNCDDIEQAWTAYADDLPRVKGLRDSDKAIARALVYSRLGRLLVDYTRRSDRRVFSCPAEEKRREYLRGNAAKYFQLSIDAYPELEASYFQLVELHEEDEELERAAGVLEKLTAAKPDCADAAIWLTKYYLARDDFRRCEPHLNTVKRLLPRDPLCATLAWNQAVTAVRCFTIKREFKAAREQMDQAQSLAPADVQPYTVDLLRAGIEFKAKNVQAAESHVQAAVSKVDDPTPIWMQMSAVAARMRVAREFKKTFDDRFKADIQKPANTVAAGRMAEFLCGMRAAKANYTGRATQEKLLIKYLDRADHIAWNDADLRHVCYFLKAVPRKFRLWEHFVHLGREQFPKTPHYHYWTGLGEYESGSMFCDIELAVESLQSAIDLNRDSQINLRPQELRDAQSTLSLVKDYQDSRAGSPFAPEFFDETEYGDFDVDLDDGEEDIPEIFDIFNDGDDDLTFAPDHETAQELLKQMPPDLKYVIKAMAISAGTSMEEALQHLIAKLEKEKELEGFDGRFQEMFDPEPKKKKKRTRKAKAKKKSKS